MTWAAVAFVYDSWKFNEVAQGLIKIPIWIPQLTFVLGVLIFFDRHARRTGRGPARSASPPTRLPKKSAARAAISRKCVDEHARPSLRSCSGCCSCCSWAASGSRSRSRRSPGSGLQFFTSTPPEVNLFQSFWGSSANWTHRRAAAVHLDGRDPVSHQALGRDVRGARAVAQLAAGPADARQRPRLRHLRHGVRLVGRDLRDDRQGRAAGADQARLRREDLPGLAVRRRHARHPAAAVHHHGGLRRGRGGLDPESVSRRFPARVSADGAVLGLHHRLGAAAIRSKTPREDDAPVASAKSCTAAAF